MAAGRPSVRAREYYACWSVSTANRFRVNPVFFDEYSRRERLDGIVVHDRHGRLENDWPAVQLRGHQMNGGSADTHAVLERLALRLETRKCGQERRVHVKDPVGERIDQRLADEPHETGKADQIHRARLEQIGQRAIVRRSIPILARAEVRGLDTCRTGAQQTSGIRPVRNDNGHAGLQRAAADGVDDRLEVASAARDEHAQPRWMAAHGLVRNMTLERGHVTNHAIAGCDTADDPCFAFTGSGKLR